jgi:hypothetical protein
MAVLIIAAPPPTAASKWLRSFGRIPAYNPKETAPEPIMILSLIPALVFFFQLLTFFQ